MSDSILEKPFVIISSLTENRGHLLLDDKFWFLNLIDRYPNTRIITSVQSKKNLLTFKPKYSSNISCFIDFPFLKKLNFRLFLFFRLAFCERVKNSRIIIQGFDELLLIFYLIRIWKCGNLLFVIPTNNISIERLDKNNYILKYLLYIIIKKTSKFYFHSNFELFLIKKYILKNEYYISRLTKIKYHLFSGVDKTDFTFPTSRQSNVISFFGPTLPSKPLSDICKLIHSDAKSKRQFVYQFINLSQEDKYHLIKLFPSYENIVFISEYLTYEDYIQLIASSLFIFLPHNFLFEGKVSGILCDCISIGTPFISNSIEPIIELFNTYGPMGFIFNYAEDDKWCTKFLNHLGEISFHQFYLSMSKCRSDHSSSEIITQFMKTVV